MKVLDEKFLSEFYGESCEIETPQPKCKTDYLNDMSDLDMMIDMYNNDLQTAINSNDKIAIADARRWIAKYKKERNQYKKQYRHLMSA